MTVEFELYAKGRKKANWPVKPKDSWSIDRHFKPSESVIECARSDDHGLYKPFGNNQFLEVYLVDEETETAAWCSAEEELEFSGPTHLEISSPKFYEEILIAYHNPDTEFDEDSLSNNIKKENKELVFG